MKFPKSRFALVVCTAALFACANLISCKRSSIFTEIDANFKSLDDVFIEEFRNQTKFVEKNTELELGSEAALTGRYGTLLTIDVWEFKSESDCQQAYATLTALEKQNNPREFDQTRATELRYKVVRATGIAGEIFTVKKVLFRLLGENPAAIQEYLISSKLARLR